LDQFLQQLLWSEEAFFRVALSKAPNPSSNDFVVRIQHISQYAGINPSEISRIIRQIESLQKLQPSNIISLQSNLRLSAAREKLNISTKDNSSNE
jgi:hypothetical protein